MTKILEWLKGFWLDFSNRRLRKNFPKLFYWIGVKEWYYNQTHEKLNYRDVKNINEKMMWLSRYWQHPLKTLCADKYRVREYVKQCGLEKILVPLFGVYEKADDIDFASLPNQFVLKCNHASGSNIICLDKDSLNSDKAKKKLNEWMNQNFGFETYEPQYEKIQRKIVCEKLLEESPLEIQLYCINGEPDFFLVCRKHLNGNYDAFSYTLDWQRVAYRIGEENRLNEKINKPTKLKEIIEYAKILSKPFPFVRVDFFYVQESIYLAELTFSSSANVLHNYTKQVIEEMGRKLVLPSKNIP